MHDPEHMPGAPLDVRSEAQRRWWLRMLLTGASDGGDAASAVYGTILAASVLVAVEAGPLITLLAVLATGVVFWLAHVHVAVMRGVVRGGEHVDAARIRHAMVEEWPLVQACVSPALPLLLAVVGVISTTTAINAGLAICLLGLVAWGVVVSRAAELNRRQTVLAVGINAGLGVLMIVLKAILH